VIGDEVKQAMSTPVTEPKVIAGLSTERDYFGWSLQVTYQTETGESETVWLDPSVLQFSNADELALELSTAVHEYQASLKES
jgi:hypothetical protein